MFNNNIFGRLEKINFHSLSTDQRNASSQDSQVPQAEIDQSVTMRESDAAQIVSSNSENVCITNSFFINYCTLTFSGWIYEECLIVLCFIA